MVTCEFQLCHLWCRVAIATLSPRSVHKADVLYPGECDLNWSLAQREAHPSAGTLSCLAGALGRPFCFSTAAGSRNMAEPTRIAIVHNRYLQSGGEDIVFRMEAELLASDGHTVLRYEYDNREVERLPPAVLACKTVWNAEAYSDLRERFAKDRPLVVHVHNTLPLVSPAVYAAARSSGAAVVQTLHNFRFLCPSATLYRNHHPCELCVGKKVPWPGVFYACYRGSRAATGAVAAMLVTHRARGTYRKEVDHYIALTDFAKRTFVRGGLPGDRITVKPNFAEDHDGGDYDAGAPLVSVGRLSDEKGIHVLAAAWQGAADLPCLRVVGDGPMRDTVEALAARNPRVALIGRLPVDDVQREYRSASALVFASTCYESLPMTIIEAYAAGLPVIAARLGAMAEVVHDGRTGLHFEPGNAEDLARKIRWLRDRPDEARRMSVEARREYERRYTPERNLDQLLAIYQTAIERFRSTR